MKHPYNPSLPGNSIKGGKNENLITFKMYVYMMTTLIGTTDIDEDVFDSRMTEQCTNNRPTDEHR